MSTSNVTAVVPMNTMNHILTFANAIEESQYWTATVLEFTRETLYEAVTLTKNNQITARIQSLFQDFGTNIAEFSKYNKEVRDLEVVIETTSKHKSRADELVTKTSNIVRNLISQKDLITIIMKTESDLHAKEIVWANCKPTFAAVGQEKDPYFKVLAANLTSQLVELRLQLEEHKNKLKKIEEETSSSEEKESQEKLNRVEQELKLMLLGQESLLSTHTDLEKELNSKILDFLTLKNMKMHHALLSQSAVMSIRREIDKQKAATNQQLTPIDFFRSCR